MIATQLRYLHAHWR